MHSWSAQPFYALFATCRAFVRPSGTESIVRIYAEAATVAETESLAVDIRDIWGSALLTILKSEFWASGLL